MSEVLIEKGLTPSQLIEQLDQFMERINALGTALGLELQHYQADHIALRINDTELAKAAHNAWGQYGQQISNAKINGRPIIVIQFSAPLISNGWSIECLELPYPAAGKSYPVESWEHVEFVIPSQALTAQAYLEDLTARFPKLADALQTADENNIKVKLSSPKGEGERLANPTVAFKSQGIAIKLHPHSLKTIVDSEHNG